MVVFVLSASFIAYAPDYIKKINEFSSDISTASLDLGTKIMLPNSDSEGKDSVCLLYTSGGGNTYFLLTLIEALLHTNAVLYILDPKNADLADLVLPPGIDARRAERCS